MKHSEKVYIVKQAGSLKALRGLRSLFSKGEIQGKVDDLAYRIGSPNLSKIFYKLPSGLFRKARPVKDMIDRSYHRGFQRHMDREHARFMEWMANFDKTMRKSRIVTDDLIRAERVRRLFGARRPMGQMGPINTPSAHNKVVKSDSYW